MSPRMQPYSFNPALRTFCDCDSCVWDAVWYYNPQVRLERPSRLPEWVTSADQLLALSMVEVGTVDRSEIKAILAILAP